MNRSRKDPVREQRIHNEAIVDAGPDEQALSWYYYLENKIRFPFKAKCRAAKVVSPLKKGEAVEVVRMSWSDGKVENWRSRSLNSSLSVQTNQPSRPSATGITGSRRAAVSDLRNTFRVPTTHRSGIQWANCQIAMAFSGDRRCGQQRDELDGWARSRIPRRRCVPRQSRLECGTVVAI